jgi:hypothetical protein
VIILTMEELGALLNMTKFSLRKRREMYRGEKERSKSMVP